MKKIPLTRGMFAIVDDEDFEELSKFNWCAFRGRYTFYAMRKVPVNGKEKVLQLHRAILKPLDSQQVDHRDGNGLNNVRSNLRLATHSQNKMNSKRYKNNKSGFKGVFWDRRDKKWRAEIRFNGNCKPLGYFSNPEDAYAAYCAAATELHGSFARFE